MFKATRAIYDALTATGALKGVNTNENGKTSAVTVPFQAPGGGSYTIIFANSDDDTDTAVRVFELFHVGMFKKAKALEACNEMNNKFRYVKFVVDKDGDLNAEYDMTVRGCDPAAASVEMVIRFSKIIEEAYPVLAAACR